jgi:hypothetical protein
MASALYKAKMAKKLITERPDLSEVYLRELIKCLEEK